MKIQVKAEGISKIKQKLKAQANNLQNMQKLWQSVGMYVQKQTIRERFDKEQAPDGTKWKPLSPATVKRRLKRHKSGNMKILQDVGELRRSIKYEAGDNYVKIGSNLKYARIHQFGGTINFKKRKGSVTIPARPFLGITANERKHINDMLRTYLKRQIFNGG